jgi:hypothetical protein
MSIPNILARKLGVGPLPYCKIKAESEGFSRQGSLATMYTIAWDKIIELACMSMAFSFFTIEPSINFLSKLHVTQCSHLASQEEHIGKFLLTPNPPR